MTLALRPVVRADGTIRPDDYNVIHEDAIIGRIYRMSSTARETWMWTQIGAWAPAFGPNGGIAYSFDEAKAAFRRAWDAMG